MQTTRHPQCVQFTSGQKRSSCVELEYFKALHLTHTCPTFRVLRWIKNILQPEPFSTPVILKCPSKQNIMAAAAIFFPPLTSGAEAKCRMSTFLRLYIKRMESFPLKGNEVSSLPPTGENWDSIQLQEDELIAASSVVSLAQFARRQNVGCRSTVITAVTLESIVLTVALYKGKDGVLLLRWRQSLGG